MNSKKRLILIIIIVLLVTIAGLYGTFAINTNVTQTDTNTYNIVLTDKKNELTMPSNTSKTVIYQLHNPNNGTVKYNIGFSGDNIDVKQYSNSSDAASGLIEAKQYKFVKLRIENTGNTDSTAVLSTVLGYENGGELIVPEGTTLVTELYGEDVEIVNIAEYVTNLYNTNTKTTVTNNNITYNYASSVNLMNDRLGSMSTGIDAGNIRYYGATPNNYIDIGDTYKEDSSVGNWESIAPGLFANATECQAYFSGEGAEITPEQLEAELGMTLEQFCGVTEIHAGDPILYRIIGVFNGKVKLIRDEVVGYYSWDTSDESINYGDGINEWSQADLMKLINPEFTGTGGSLWYNGSSGECYTDEDNATSACDFTNTGLNNQVKPLIADDTWYLGGWDDSEIYANDIYGYERGENVCGKNGIECVGFNDGIERTTRWTGKIGLIYPSDYGYAVDFNSCTSTLYSYDECRTSNWLAGTAEWMITPSSSYGDCAWPAFDDGSVYDHNPVNYGVYGVRPVFSLISNAEMEKHEGTKLDPYVLSLS